VDSLQVPESLQEPKVVEGDLPGFFSNMWGITGYPAANSSWTENGSTIWLFNIAMENHNF